ncbi:L-seryl-tRNA(Ser) seleniumtransferase [Desulfitispora alkaliphila]|uniref:L-seryl-tRNA(Sec) selenium transferase n=1 Tax=Desulfitispora alkaliphila TaxID=622674 RepID=UPI003D1BC4E0
MRQKNELLRAIPSVDRLLQHSDLKSWKEKNKKVTEVIRKVLDNTRSNILSQELELNEEIIDEEIIIKKVIKKLRDKSEPKLKQVINATGVVLHTNLGRAVLSEEAQQAVARVANNYSNLEFNLESGKRGSRYSHVEELLCELTGAESALVVNNNASAVLLVLTALAKGKQVVVSRGQLIEIGGSFRIPEIMEQSQAELVEVGTTNKTYSSDYERAIGEETGLLLKVHTSNYVIKGFTKETTNEELVDLGQKYNLPVVEDLGSGFLVDLDRLRIRASEIEPTVQSCVSSGVDVVTFSGDKLLGGPQAGIIVGRESYISKIKKCPLTRAVRIDKFTVAALEATLRSYYFGNEIEEIPTLRMLSSKQEEIHRRSEKVIAKLKSQLDSDIEIELHSGNSQVGGGALPTTDLPTANISIKASRINSKQLMDRMRDGKPSVIARIENERVLLDLRTVFPNQEESLISAIVGILRGK